MEVSISTILIRSVVVDIQKCVNNDADQSLWVVT